MPSIGVLEHTQKPTDRPSKRIKRSGGQSLVRQMKAYWIIENVLLQMLAEHCRQQNSQVHANLGHTHVKSTPKAVVHYIPDSMPPVIDKRLGVRFEDPIKTPGMPRFRRIWSGEKYNQPMLPNGCEASS
jgi:hypothetical protein